MQDMDYDNVLDVPVIRMMQYIGLHIISPVDVHEHSSAQRSDKNEHPVSKKTIITHCVSNYQVLLTTWAKIQLTPWASGFFSEQNRPKLWAKPTICSRKQLKPNSVTKSLHHPPIAHCLLSGWLDRQLGRRDGGETWYKNAINKSVCRDFQQYQHFLFCFR